MAAQARNAGKATRTVLFLQGPPSGFWRQLGRTFEAHGARTVRVALCAGDFLYWPSFRTKFYLGRRQEWAAWIERLITQHSITDVIYNGDRNPYHREAAQVARKNGVRHYVCEFGYLRPCWLTLEHGGMGIYSHFPNDPEAIKAAASGLDCLDAKSNYGHSWLWESFQEVVYSITNLLYRPIFRHYDPDRFYGTLPEFFSGMKRHLKRMADRQTHQSVMEACELGQWPYVLYPLQLQSDWQVRANSPYTDQRDALDVVLKSMAAHAAKNLRLVVKRHPLDSGMVDWPFEVARIAKHYGLQDRVLFIDGGDLRALMQRSQGVVLINSTVGLQALQLGIPVLALGIAIYDIPGLTHHTGIAAFWTKPEPVDRSLVASLERLLAATIQIRGSFYNAEGRERAVNEIVARVLEDRVNYPDGYVDPPPRIARAIELGISVDADQGR
jgi:capsular polysaccharide export protein